MPIRNRKQSSAVWVAFAFAALILAGPGVTVALAQSDVPHVEIYGFVQADYIQDFNRVDPTTHQTIPPSCDSGAPCVYARYLAVGNGPQLAAAGITDVATFTTFYWNQQAAAAGTVLVLTLIGGLGGGLLYGTFRPKLSQSAVNVTG